jgi:hypothetical protein
MFGLAVLTRYEYVLIMVPMIILIINRSRYWAWKITNIFIPAFLLIGFTFLYLSSPYSAASLWVQLQDLFYLAAATSVVCLAAYASRKYWLNLIFPSIKNYYYLLIALVITGAAIFIYDGLRRFVINDFLLVILAFVGFRLMFGLKKHQPAGLFLLVSAVLLGAVYYRINPGMERYLTHLLPFLIIPAALAGECMVRKYIKFSQSQFSRALMLLLITLFGLQTSMTYLGLHDRNDGIWFLPGYEQLSAQQLNMTIDNNALILTAMPEPYNFFTSNSTYSIAADYPYIYIEDYLNNREIYVINDHSMQQYFPAFSVFIESSLQNYLFSQYAVNTPFRFRDQITTDVSGVKVYKIKLIELRARLEDYVQIH